MVQTPEPFDPYFKWLGIRPKDQPANHYRLLGIELFESDGDVIANGADARMTHVKTFQAGRYSAISQKILTELAAAKVCLYNPQKKAEYDAALRKHLAALGGETASEPVASELPVASEVEVPPDVEEFPIGTSVGSSITHHHRRAKKSMAPLVWMVAGVGGVGAAVVIGLMLSGQSSSERPGAEPATAPHGHGTAPASEVAVMAPVKTGAAVVASPEHENPKLVQKPKRIDTAVATHGGPSHAVDTAVPGSGTSAVAPSSGTPGAIVPSTATSSTVASIVRSSSASVVPAGETPTVTVTSNDGAVGPPAVKPPATVPAEEPPAAHQSPKKALVPDTLALVAARKAVKTLLDKDFLGAKTSEQRLELSAKLRKQAQDTRDDPATRYVLFQMAYDQAATAGEVSRVLDIIDDMARCFDLSVGEIKLLALTKASQSARGSASANEMLPEVLDAALAAVDDAVAAEDFDSALKLARLSAALAERLKNPQAILAAGKRKGEIEKAKEFARSVAAAKSTLESDPADPKANLLVGRWLCMQKSDWKQGLPLLIKSDDPTWAPLAKDDRAGPKDGEAQYALAERWWKLAQAESGSARQALQMRAVFWYRQALPGLTGLNRLAAEKQIAAAETTPAASSVKAVRAAVQPGNVASSANGAQVSSGESSLIDPSFVGTIHGIVPCEWVVTLDKVYNLREIRFYLYTSTTMGGYAYNYVLEVSPDEQQYSVVADCRDKQYFDWQDHRFAARPVKSLRLRGTAAVSAMTTIAGSSISSGSFRVSHVEAYCIPLTPGSAGSSTAGTKPTHHIIGQPRQ